MMCIYIYIRLFLKKIFPNMDQFLFSLLFSIKAFFKLFIIYSIFLPVFNKIMPRKLGTEVYDYNNICSREGQYDLKNNIGNFFNLNLSSKLWYWWERDKYTSSKSRDWFHLWISQASNFTQKRLSNICL